MAAHIDILSEEACISTTHPTKVAIAPVWWGLPSEKLSELSLPTLRLSSSESFD
ncbi:MAG: hypothetical protein J1F07_02765 [Muribaculaceae bacterium]|nr:hypothetical protein [Muribaculaceae bacterium]